MVEGLHELDLLEDGGFGVGVQTDFLCGYLLIYFHDVALVVVGGLDQVGLAETPLTDLLYCLINRVFLPKTTLYAFVFIRYSGFQFPVHL